MEKKDQTMPEEASGLVNFYRDPSGASGAPFSRREIWDMDDNAMELDHDFIQWLFPLDKPSQFKPDAPQLTNVAQQIFKEGSVIQGNLRISLKRFLAYLGIEMDEAGVYQWKRMPASVWVAFNHNHLRITRLLRCLGLTGFKNEQRRVWDVLRRIARQRNSGVTARTLSFWEEAAQEG